jgi:hypothetical protein
MCAAGEAKPSERQGDIDWGDARIVVRAQFVRRARTEADGRRVQEWERSAEWCDGDVGGVGAWTSRQHEREPVVI